MVIAQDIRRPPFTKLVMPIAPGIAAFLKGAKPTIGIAPAITPARVLSKIITDKRVPRLARIRAIDVKIPTSVKKAWTPAQRRGAIVLGAEEPRIIQTFNGVVLTEV